MERAEYLSAAVRATLRQHTGELPTGLIVKSVEPKGHQSNSDVTFPSGKSRLVAPCCARPDPPLDDGHRPLRTKLDLPPGQDKLSDRLYLKGKFFRSIGVHFTNDKIPKQLDALSMRSQGQAEA